MNQPDPWPLKFLMVAVIAICFGTAILAIVEAIVR